MSVPRSLYLHVPFCRTLCGYCDFYSERLERRAVPALVDALLRELDHATAEHPGPFDTIFVGGGTPTVLPPAELARLLNAARQLAETEAPLEFTVEANPATVTPAVAQVLRAAGVNRVSIGAQSFDPAELRILDRRHRPEQVAQTVARCRAAGLTRISLDLIFGVPGQSLASWERSLAAALELEPEHLSCYGLTYEDGTPLRARLDAGRVTPLDEDLEAAMFERTRSVLAAAGLRQYEISNYARDGAECRHNLRYWRNEPHLGIGPSAAGFVDDVRYKNVSDMSAYVAAIRAGRSPRVEEETLPPERRARETAMLNLRLIEGIDRAAFAARFGRDPTLLFADALAVHVPAGRLEITPTHIRLTSAGLLLANRVMEDFV